MRGATLAHRLLCIPVHGSRLTFYLKPIPLHKKVSSADFVNWRSQNAWSTRMTRMCQWAVYRSIESAEEQWNALEQAQDKTWRKRVYDLIDTYLLTYVYPEETLCKAIEVPGPESPDVGFQILHPERYDEGEVLRQLSDTLSNGRVYHKKWSFWSNCCLGLTGALFAIPGPPNVPFYWNAYRSYCHYKAHRGAHYFLLQLAEAFKGVRIAEELRDSPLAKLKPVRIELAPCSELDDLRQLKSDDDVISMEAIDAVSEEFSDPGLHAHLRNAVRMLPKRRDFDK